MAVSLFSTKKAALSHGLLQEEEEKKKKNAAVCCTTLLTAHVVRFLPLTNMKGFTYFVLLYI